MAAKPKALVVGNWKMYIDSIEKARDLVSALKRKEKNFKKVEVWVAPPAAFVASLANMLKQSNIRIGAQQVSQFENGAHTGEVSAAMQKSAGAAFVIVGHSERRAQGESDEQIHAQLASALASGMQVVLCVGERERDLHGGHFEFVANQIRSALVDAQKPSFAKVIIAYEPVWAIGKSAEEAAQPDLVREAVIFIRKTLADIAGRDMALRATVLYGGSVDATNAPALMEEGGIGGFLVGRASTDLEQFFAILSLGKAPQARAPSKTISKKVPQLSKTKRNPIVSRAQRRR